MFFIVAEKNFKYFFFIQCIRRTLSRMDSKSLSDDSDESDTDKKPRNKTEVHSVPKILTSVENYLEYVFPYNITLRKL